MKGLRPGKKIIRFSSLPLPKFQSTCTPQVHGYSKRPLGSSASTAVGAGRYSINLDHDIIIIIIIMHL
jgi:hypothetical protein